MLKLTQIVKGHVVTLIEAGIHLITCDPGARFSKVPKLLGRISGDISSKGRRLEARNFAVILIFILFTTYEKTSFTEWADRGFTNGFSGSKSFRDSRETGPWTYLKMTAKMNYFIYCIPSLFERTTGKGASDF